MSKKTTLACEWLYTYGGAERVLSSLADLYPEAKIITSYYDPKKMAKFFPLEKIQTLWTDKIPYFRKKHKLLPVLRALAFKFKRPIDTDLLIVSSGSEAKALRVKKGGKQITYCHAPTHFLWQRTDEYLNNTGLGALSLIAKPAMKLLLPLLRKMDFAAAQNPDQLITNSTHTQKMIKKYYLRDSTVIHPPVEVERFGKLKDKFKRKGLIITGRHAPYKGFDLAIQACTKLKFNLTVLGEGPETEKLKKMAGPTIKFKGWASEQEKEELIASAEGFLFPGIDDFGISAVEALAAGTPVIALKAGGALDYIQDGINGVFFDKKDVKSLESALKKFSGLKLKPESVSKTVNHFSEKEFKTKITRFITSI
jgi:glycosyltransferase involved in cell wall biosynthesis